MYDAPVSCFSMNGELALRYPETQVLPIVLLARMHRQTPTGLHNSLSPKLSALSKGAM